MTLERDCNPRKFTKEMQEWLVQYFLANPESYLDEAKVQFEARWAMEISLSSVWRIIHEHGLTLKAHMQVNLRLA